MSDGTVEFNKKIGVDVRYLPSWKPGQEQPCLNIVDYGSRFQVMIQIPNQVSKTLRMAYRDNWFRWAGGPDEMVVDAARANIGTALTDPLEMEGTVISPIEGEGQWQNDRAEVHGGWWTRIFKKVVETAQPANESE